MKKNNKCKLTIHSANQDQQIIQVRKGLGLMALHLKEKTPLEFSCCKADCGVCLFTILDGEDNFSSPSEVEKDFLTAMKSPKNERLACQTRIFGDASIYINTDW